MLSKVKSFTCSLWAQQGSNLRPLGEQRTVYSKCKTPADHAARDLSVYRITPASTSFTDDKVTADLGGQAIETNTAILPLPAIFVASPVLAVMGRKTGAR